MSEYISIEMIPYYEMDDAGDRHSKALCIEKCRELGFDDARIRSLMGVAPDTDLTQYDHENE